MNARYLWQAPYLAAVLEPDDSKVIGLIYEARAAIEQRLLSPVEAGGQEEKALRAAQTGIAALHAERATDQLIRRKRN